ncbi:uncharacterized protein HMPREF1541_07059 [Cyphellophora europaea CBS 101466]|uniref:Ras-GEF domain-containing protein n=1 Tax=Cyphellophora europaea (strain CBS 101466) TaxID=1220924 RepID=W2RRD5_CYPE1|nr:uncharacterized protein HMPREF1541_07059 [Cyphellophora europaea CBS 101466]ETN39017.1 hypothetical protein HMPREF1541_07059 [Cyphellophora europaea CBS 101466]
MQQHQQQSDIFVAPLQIRKFSPDSPSRQNHIHMHNVEPTADPSVPARARFQNYLRAAYPFQPASSPSPSTVTLPLNSGDIILIHSVHTNGWADGTLLETGERGWLPTNYCEAYDYTAMRPLLRALTEFWDIMRCSSDSNLAIFQNKDYMRGLVAGVRYLLEKCDCLTRDSINVRRHDGIRRTRKGLLSDLSLLVKAGKQLQSMSQENEALVDGLLDELLLQAFKIVTRAVKFFDIWGEEIAFARSLSGLNDIGPESGKLSATTTAEARRVSAAARLSYQAPQSPGQPHTENKRASITHRMSYTSRPDRSEKLHLASEQLNSSYDAFLGVLASFLGSHMQSRSSSELLLTTQQAVKSCRALLSVVELVIDRALAHTDSLTDSKDSLYDAITELVRAAEQVFRPLHSQDDELIYLPEEGRRLVHAATNCVSGAGRCIARTRAVLEEKGDFEIEPGQLERSSGSSSTQTPARTSYDHSTSSLGHRLSGAKEPKHDLPWLNIPEEEELSRHRGESPSTIASSVPPTPADDHPTGTLLPSTSSQTTLHSPIQLDRPVSNEYAIPVGHLRHKSLVRGINQSTSSSESASDSSHNTNDPSDMSTGSTAGTSYKDGNSAHFSSQESLVHSSNAAPEDEGEAVVLEKTYAHELMYNRDGQLIGGTLHALVEKLTAPDSTPDALFVATVYLTFRLFAKPEDFVAALIWRFRYSGDASMSGPVRLRVYNVLKGWLESHWRHDCDDHALPAIIAFAREDLAPVIPTASRRLLELAETVGSTHTPAVPRVQSAIGKTSTSSAAYINPSVPLPNPVLSKSQLTALRTWKSGGASVSIHDFDPLELARQITLKTSQLFCSILPEELLATEWTKQSSSLAVNVRAMSTLSTDISNLVSESILQLEDPKKRALLIKQWTKIAKRCLDLNNYDSVFAIVCSLDSTNIKRMRKTWDLVSQKTKTTIEELKKVTDHTRNYSALRQTLQNQVPPCLPFIGMYLTDLTFVDHGNPATRQLNNQNTSVQVINLDKHMKTARIISDLQRFQIPYRFQEVSELQTWMQDQLIKVRSNGEKNYQNHYRRSLILEPREVAAPAKLSPNPEGSGTREKFDLLAWTHLGRAKSTASPIPPPSPVEAT